MPISIVSIIILVGLALIVIALLGGGIEVKEIKIPSLQIIPRVLSFFTGCALVALCLFRPDIFQGLNDNKIPPVSPPNPAPIMNPPPPDIKPIPPVPTLIPSPIVKPPPPDTKPIPIIPGSTSWFVMLGSFNANNGDLAVNSARRVKNKASEECHVSARTELTAKMEGFTPGYVSAFLGPYDTQEGAAADKEKVLPCVPDAYIKSINGSK
jgi:hypothetical protein